MLHVHAFTQHNEETSILDGLLGKWDFAIMKSWELSFMPIFLIFEISEYNNIIQYKTIFIIIDFGGIIQKALDDGRT